MSAAAGRHRESPASGDTCPSSERDLCVLTYTVWVGAELVCLSRVVSNSACVSCFSFRRQFAGEVCDENGQTIAVPSCDVRSGFVD